MLRKLIFLTLYSIASIAIAQVSPLLSTSWNQGCYYNSACPTRTAGPCGRAFTGCNATAMAQLMKYHSYPSTGWGSHTHGTLTANYAATTYNWAAMPNALSTENTEIATLMLHLGIGVDMNYSPSNSTSGADASIFKKHFKYSLSVRGAMKTSNTQWENLIKSELDAGRPIFVKGGAHFYVIDGYQVSPLKFHCNFGWGGSYDGYYNLHSIVVAGNDFTPTTATIGIKPLTSPMEAPDTIIINAGAGSTAGFEFSSLGSWNMTSTETWLTPGMSSGSEGYFHYQNGATVSVTSNNSYTPRYAKLRITSGIYKDSIVVKQNGIAPSLNTSLSNLTYASSSSSQSVGITSDSIWTATSADSWISISPSTGNGNEDIVITVTANASVSRTGSVVIKRGSLQKVITLYQAASGSFWCIPAFASVTSVGVTNISLKTINRNSTVGEGYINTGNSTTLKIDSTYSVSATISGFVAPAIWIDWNIDGDFNDAGEAVVAPSGSWYPSNSGTKSINFTVPSDAVEGTTRMRVYIKSFGSGPISSPCNTTDTGGDIEDYTIVVIHHKHITVSPSSLLYSYAAATQGSSINTDSSWTASASESWFNFTPSTGSGNQIIQITTTQNNSLVTRSSVLTITRGSKSKTIVITQQGADTVLYLVTAAASISSTGEVSSFEITSNIHYSINTPDSWIHVDSSAGTGSKSYSFSVDMNPTSSPRTGTIIISKGNYLQTFSVSQDGTPATLTVSPSTITKNENGGSETIDITTSGGWTISSSDSWLTFSSTSGSGNTSVSLSIEANTGSTSRSGTVTITNGLVLQTITVNQAGTTGVYETSENQHLKIYPNPVKGVLMIQMNSTEKIEVFNILGQKENCLVEKNGDLLQINMEALLQGIYLLKIQNTLYRVAKE